MSKRRKALFKQKAFAKEKKEKKTLQINLPVTKKQLAFLVLLGISFYLSIVFLKDNLLGETQFRIHRTWLMKKSLLHLELPNWDPYIHAGIQTFRAYPALPLVLPTLLSFVTGAELAIRISLFFYYVASAVTMFFVVKKIARSSLVALLSAIAYRFSYFGYFFQPIFSGSMGIIFSCIFLPLSFYYFFYGRGKRELVFGALSTAAIAFSHTITIFLLVVMYVVFFFLSAAFDFFKKRLEIDLFKIKMIIFALILSTYYFVPAMNQLRFMSEHYMTGEELLRSFTNQKFSLKKQALQFQNPVVFVFALLCVANYRSKINLFLFVLILLNSFLVTGAFADHIIKIPFMKFIQMVWRFQIMNNLFVPIAFALSLEFLGNKMQRGKLRKLSKLLAPFLVLTLLISIIYILPYKREIQDFYHSYSSESKQALKDVRSDEFFRLMELPPGGVNTEQVYSVLFAEKPIVSGKFIPTLAGQKDLMDRVLHNISFYERAENLAYLFELMGVSYVFTDKTALSYSWGAPWKEIIDIARGFQKGEPTETKDIILFSVNNTPKRVFFADELAAISGNRSCLSNLMIILMQQRARFFDGVIITSVLDEPSGYDVLFGCDQALEIRDYIRSKQGKQAKMSGYKSSPNRMEFDVEVPEDGYLLINEAWDYEWSATVDGEKAKIIRAQPEFIAIKIAGGGHHVALKNSQGIIGWVSMIVSIATLACLLFLLKKSFKKEEVSIKEQR